MTSKTKNAKYKCPFCEGSKTYTREDLVRHVTDNHEEDLPEDFTPLRYVFNYVNRKPVSYHGVCTECKRETPWNEEVGRYDRQCGREACRKSFVKKFEANMIKSVGVTRISATKEGQLKMLANRKISGTYKFQDGTEKTYTGSYELKALEFMDKVMHIKSSDIMCPGPILEYEYDGHTHIYITDFYYQPYNLIIEVKDGGDKPNTRNMPEYRAKQAAKEKYIKNNTNYNYLRLVNNELEQLLSTFMRIKMELEENTGARVLNINESMGMTSYMPVVGINSPQSAYIVNYMQNNVFSGEKTENYVLTNNIMFDTIIGRNKEGVLEKTTKDILFNTTYDVYEVQLSKEASKIIHDHLHQFVPYEFLYETIFNKKMYTKDQIKVTNEAIPVIDYYKQLDYIDEIVKNRYHISIPESVQYDENGIGLFDTLEGVFLTCKGKVEYIVNIPNDYDINNIRKLEQYNFLYNLIQRSGLRRVENE